MSAHTRSWEKGSRREGALGNVYFSSLWLESTLVYSRVLYPEDQFFSLPGPKVLFLALCICKGGKSLQKHLIVGSSFKPYNF